MHYFLALVSMVASSFMMPLLFKYLMVCIECCEAFVRSQLDLSGPLTHTQCSIMIGSGPNFCLDPKWSRSCLTSDETRFYNSPNTSNLYI